MSRVLEPSSSSGEPAESFKYFAFLSYSHRDGKVASALHRALEQYQVPAPLVGTGGRDGAVPKRVFPIFRDREELSSSSDLSAAIREALARSACLVVLCSPDAAASRWVNKEILAFQQLGRHDRILAVIVSGEPHDENPGRECFPPALREVEVVAADLRPEGDGPHDAKLKVLAGILGVSLNELRRRELVAARRRMRIFQGIAATMFGLAVAAASGGWIAYRNLQKAERRFDLAMNIASGVVDRAVDMSKKFGVPKKPTGELLTWADQSFEALSREELPEALEYQRANLLIAFSDHFEAVGEGADQLRSATQARDLLARLVETHPDADEWRERLSMAYDRIGNAQVATGQLAAALSAYRQSLASDALLLSKMPKDPARRRAVGAGHERIGTALAMQGDLQGALNEQRQSLSLAKLVAQDRPNDLRAQGDVAASQVKLGEILQNFGHDKEALDQYREAIYVRNAVANRAPDDTQQKRELEVVYNKVGQMLLGMEDVAGAYDNHQEALRIAVELAKSDPGNVEWQHDLAATRLWHGDTFFSAGHMAEALQDFEASRDIAYRLVHDNPGNVLYQFGLGGALERVGDVQMRLRHYDAALFNYDQKRIGIDQLARQDPTNAEFERDLVIAYVKVAQARQAMGGEPGQVLDSYSIALDHVRRLAAAGRLGAADAWMVGSLDKQVARLKSGSGGNASE